MAYFRKYLIECLLYSLLNMQLLNTEYVETVYQYNRCLSEKLSALLCDVIKCKRFAQNNLKAVKMQWKHPTTIALMI